ncbi:BQ5605_C022g09554 [Microbotryum silenes-dioicae]|uniref:BQ5605_C022g09554 protein n=1 Tax=Microbotryum silenes-dioicae TaxID=796604 RepID=A0A2X0MKZ1_9BASI|nr:BQ5605_C022g09554 [Microbotryum silenes-dioicae]
MYQHTVVSAAPACGVGVPIRSHMYQHTGLSAAPTYGAHVPIRSHVQALW